MTVMPEISSLPFLQRPSPNHSKPFRPPSSLHNLEPGEKNHKYPHWLWLISPCDETVTRPRAFPQTWCYWALLLIIHQVVTRALILYV